MSHRRVLSLAALVALSSSVAACSGGGAGNVVPPSAPSISGVGVFDESAAKCEVSYDGFISYTVPSGMFSPIDVRTSACARTLGRNSAPIMPSWAKPNGPTKTVFVATSLQQTYSNAGMQSIESEASASGIPVTWMIGNPAYLMNAPAYSAFHTQNGDDVESIDDASLIGELETALPWFTPKVSVEGGGAERNISGLRALGETAFWGITWDTQGIDGDWDLGAPWGSYCADPNSYKRPTAGGSCALVAFEWTARDLTRAYLSRHSEYFSTDPDDLLERAGFNTQGAIAYIEALTDAYAAAGQTQPIVMMSQQESAENLNPGDGSIMAALYARAKADGMKVETLRTAAVDAATFSAAPRAVAFPSLPGGVAIPSDILGADQTLYPATIDFHDNAAGMTFLAGHTTPTRVFPYALDPQSSFNMPLAQLQAAQMPKLTAVAAANGAISFAFSSPQATHYGVAIWSDPSTLGIKGSNVFPAGRAGTVITFDLQAGANTVSVPCSGCSGTTFTYST